MASKLLKTLSAAQRGLYPVLRKAVREDLSIARIGKAVRAQGYHIAENRLRPLIRAERDIVSFGRSLRDLPRSRVIPVTKLPEALTATRRKYSYAVRVEGYMLDTQEQVVKYVQVTTNKRLTRGEVEDSAIVSARSFQSRYGMEVSRAEISFGTRAGEEGVL
jgi:hypothetical protein